jgi:hypothetical protein
MPIPESPLAVIKRKRSEGNLDETEQRAPEAKSQKQRVSTMTNISTNLARAMELTPTEEFPNGFFYCHQCNKKRDSSGELKQALIMSSATSLISFPSRTILHLQDQVLSLSYPLQGQVLQAMS